MLSRRASVIVGLLCGGTVMARAQTPSALQREVFVAESSFAHSMAARDIQAFASFRRDPDGRWRIVFDKGCP